MPTLEHKCPSCSNLNKIEVGYVDPSLYTKPEKASVTRAHWCSKCNELIGCKYRFPNPNTVEFIQNVKLKPAPYVSYGRSTHVDEEEETEDTITVNLEDLFSEGD